MPFWNKKDRRGEPPKKETLADKFRRAAGQLRRLTLKDLGKMTRQTLSDLKQPKEAGGLIVAIIVPGGMFGWFAYRIDKYRRRHAANDNHAPRPDALPEQDRAQNQAARKKPPRPQPPKN